MKTRIDRRLNFIWIMLVLAVIPASAHAHFQMLLPSATSGRTDQPVTVTYQWGHPFEHQLFNAPKPESVSMISPDGTRSNLADSLRKIDVPCPENRSVSAFQFTMTPRQRGDHAIVICTPPIWMNEERLFLQDTVKTIYHVQTQNGWDAVAGLAFEIVPMTRPYGLVPSMVFQGRVFSDRQPMAGVIVEVERYNEKPPKELSADEMITRAVKTDPNGVFTCTLTEPGWWCLTAARDGGQREHDGKMYPVKQRATFWVYVDERSSK